MVTGNFMERVTEIDDSRLDPYRNLKQNKHSASTDYFVAEGRFVLAEPRVAIDPRDRLVDQPSGVWSNDHRHDLRGALANRTVFQDAQTKSAHLYLCRHERKRVENSDLDSIDLDPADQDLSLSLAARLVDVESGRAAARLRKYPVHPPAQRAVQTVRVSRDIHRGISRPFQKYPTISFLTAPNMLFFLLPMEVSL